MLRSDFNPRDDAVVIGASMAGLLAARVLADHFARVTLVERDRLPDGPTFRTGVPQSRHLHVLLARGLEVIGQLFPGIEQELVGGGGSGRVAGRIGSTPGSRSCQQAGSFWNGASAAAAQGALVLDRLLRERADDDPAELPRRFQREVAKVNAGAWLIATGEDLRYPTTEGGERNLQTRLIHRYLDRVIGAATRDKSVNRAFLDVLQLVASPTTLFQPRILVPALLRGGARRTNTPPTATRLGESGAEAAGPPSCPV